MHTWDMLTCVMHRSNMNSKNINVIYVYMAILCTAKIVLLEDLLLGCCDSMVNV